ncbi:MAG TPA: class I poly(R)-hydroxyalkanoic acid synthase, partial [Desulfurivibrionaceae bacterium]|nr:class I poly(R)-hydroxyalkanoic acid synthase [Desulfurivibrionaceae bacterium]
RFKDEAWRENALSDLLKQAYLISAQWMLETTDSLEGLNPDLHRQATFWAQQVVDAMSPANFAFSNPEVMAETARTGGMNLWRGWQNLVADLRQGRISQVDSGAFEVGRDLAVTPGKVVYRNRLMELIQYEPTTETVQAVPMLIVPPWINKYYVMDLRPQNSLYRHLLDAGFTVFTISWKNADQSLLDLSWDDYMDLGPLDALRVVRAITGAEKVNLTGYCLGGIILQVTLAYLAARGEDGAVNTATYFTTHQDFSNAGDIAVFINRPGVAFLEWLMSASGGYLDGRNLAATFNMLRANSLVWNYVVQNYLMGKEPPAFDLLYWNSDGTRVPGKVHSFLVRRFFLENKLMQPNGIEVKGVGVDLGRITTPTYAVAGDRDHIVPWQGAFRVRDLQGGPVRFVLAGGGHIAGIINPPADQKRAYWINEEKDADPEAWLAAADKTEGSWWPDWFAWLAERSGNAQAPSPMGSED